MSVGKGFHLLGSNLPGDVLELADFGKDQLLEIVVADLVLAQAGLVHLNISTKNENEDE